MLLLYHDFGQLGLWDGSNSYTSGIGNESNQLGTSFGTGDMHEID